MKQWKQNIPVGDTIWLGYKFSYVVTLLRLIFGNNLVKDWYDNVEVSERFRESLAYISKVVLECFEPQ